MRIQFRNISQGQYLNINTFNLKDKNKKKKPKKKSIMILNTHSHTKAKTQKKNTICNIVILLLDLTLCKYIIQII